VFGINGAEFLVILLVAALVVGPDGVVQALKTFRNVIATLKGWSARLREETRRDMSDTALPSVDWSAFDLREYDPREMVRQAVREEMEEWVKAGSSASGPRPQPLSHPAPHPVDASGAHQPATAPTDSSTQDRPR
jgi:hypothetical protein